VVKQIDRLYAGHRALPAKTQAEGSEGFSHLCQSRSGEYGEPGQTSTAPALSLLGRRCASLADPSPSLGSISVVGADSRQATRVTSFSLASIERATRSSNKSIHPLRDWHESEKPYNRTLCPFGCTAGHCVVQRIYSINLSRRAGLFASRRRRACCRRF